MSFKKVSSLFFITCIMLCLVPAYTNAACTNINSLPRTISSSGCYILSGNLTTSIASGNAITINADDVLLDLSGYYIKNTNNANAANGIYADGRSNVTVKNGSVIGFGSNGIYFHQGGNPGVGNVVDSIYVNTETANDRGIGIFDQNNGTIISNCRVKGTPTNVRQAIDSEGNNSRVINNEIIDQGGTAGLDVTGSGHVVENNRVTNSTITSGSGINLQDGNGIVATGNVIINKEVGISGGASGIYRDNITWGCTTPYDLPSMINAGNNQ